MPTKKPTPDDIHYLFFNESKQPGRRPAKPKGVEARLRQLIKESNAWVRLCAEVWFAKNDPVVEEAIGGSVLPDLADQYDEAITAVQWVAGCANKAKEILKAGKKKAVEKRRQGQQTSLKKKPAKKKSVKKPAKRKSKKTSVDK